MKRLIATAIYAMCAMAATSAAAADAPTYNKDIAPILYSSCVECHRPNQIAPMSLLSYQEARPWAKAIKAKVTAREMPPWFADPRYGKLENDKSLVAGRHRQDERLGRRRRAAGRGHARRRRRISGRWMEPSLGSRSRSRHRLSRSTGRSTPKARCRTSTSTRRCRSTNRGWSPPRRSCRATSARRITSRRPS